MAAEASDDQLYHPDSGHTENRTGETDMITDISGRDYFEKEKTTR